MHVLQIYEKNTRHSNESFSFGRFWHSKPPKRSMLVFTSPSDWSDLRQRMYPSETSVGFVPTMGALHAGHQSLMRRAALENDVCLSSVFVNPTQFNQSSDLVNYPRTLQEDLTVAEAAGCDLLFVPQISTMYGNDVSTQSTNYGALTHSLEGKFRPGHFDGVVTIVRKLLRMLGPHKLYLGEKDFQQLAVIRELVRRESIPTQVVGCALVRDHDGLALSSRNVRLTAAGRQIALAGYETLKHMQQKSVELDPQRLAKWGRRHLEMQNGLGLEYLEVVDAQNLQAAENWNEPQEIRALLAFYVDGVRLIDNVVLNPNTAR